jgi:flagellar assembly factor FliW
MNAAEMDDPTEAPEGNEMFLQFPNGILGFEQIKQFVLLSNAEEEPFRWLQVVDDPSLAFVVVSPFVVLADYQPDISPDDVRYLGLSSPEDALLFNIVTIRPNGRSTVNLKGPIVINRHTLKGKQVILCNASKYSVQHPLPTAP